MINKTVNDSASNAKLMNAPCDSRNKVDPIGIIRNHGNIGESSPPVTPQIAARIMEAVIMVMVAALWNCPLFFKI